METGFKEIWESIWLISTERERSSTGFKTADFTAYGIKEPLSEFGL
jgi:hypothetical protein